MFTTKKEEGDRITSGRINLWEKKNCNIICIVTVDIKRNKEKERINAHDRSTRPRERVESECVCSAKVRVGSSKLCVESGWVLGKG